MKSVKIHCGSCGNDMVVFCGENATCEYCGNVYVAPADEKAEKILNLKSKADAAWNHWDFDEAAKYYLEILDINNKLADAHFGLVLCKYGIAYELDPFSNTMKPSCNRVNRESVLNDKHYLAAIEYAAPENLEMYKTRAQEIDRITRDYLTIVDSEPPYDIFISYKKTSEYGTDTPDAKIARNLYLKLAVEMGYKVFFAEETLKSVGGNKFEPYIFSALSSSTVMILLASQPDYLEATWVKNEWRRFRAFKEEDDNKIIIPVCIGTMKPENFPIEIRALNPQMLFTDEFFYQSIQLSVEKKFINKNKQIAQAQVSEASENVTVSNLLGRIEMFLQDGDWAEVVKYCNRVLDTDYENARAYLYLLLAEYRVRSIDELANVNQGLDYNGNYQKAVKFADADLKRSLEECNAAINRRIGDKNKKIREVEYKKNAVLEEIAMANDTKAKLEAQCNSLEKEITNHNSKLAGLKASINAKKDEISKSNALSKGKDCAWWLIFMIPSFIYMLFFVLEIVCFEILTELNLPASVFDVIIKLSRVIDSYSTVFIVLFWVCGAIGLISPVIYITVYNSESNKEDSEKSFWKNFKTWCYAVAVSYVVLLILINNPLRMIGEGISSFFGLFGKPDLIREGTVQLTYFIVSVISSLIGFGYLIASRSKRRKAKRKIRKLKKALAADENAYNSAITSDKVLVELQGKLDDAHMHYTREASYWQNKLNATYNDYVSTANKYSISYTRIDLPVWSAKYSYSASAVRRASTPSASGSNSGMSSSRDDDSAKAPTMADLKALEERNKAAQMELEKLRAERAALEAQKAALQDRVNSSQTSADQKYYVRLTNVENAKLDIIKYIRDITGLDLKGAKDFVDSVPSRMLVCPTLEDAERIKNQLEGFGAIAVITTENN